MPNSAGGVVVERSVPLTGKPRWRRECGERAPSARKLNAWVASIPRIESITGGGKSHIMCAITVSAGPWPTPARLFEVFQQLLRGAVGLKRTGVDHASVEYQSSTGTLAPVGAKKPSAAISVAEVIARIMAALPPMRELAC